MNSDLQRQIRERMNLKETDELLDIWRINNRAEWSDEAFEVVKEILQERGEIVPEQDAPVYTIKEDEKEIPDKGLEEWEARLLDEESQPEFYSVLDVILLKRNINRVANAAIVIYLVIGFLNVPWQAVEFLRGGSISLSVVSQYGFEIMVTVLTIGLRIAVIYFPLKALIHILRILMEMEIRSRKAD